MKKNIRVALSFATLTDAQLNSFAILVIACTKGNSLFPDLPFTTTALTLLQNTFESAMTVAAQGGPKDTAAKNEARDALVAALRQIAAYIQSLGLNNMSAMLSSGFDVVVPGNGHGHGPLEPPVLSGLDNSVSTQLQLRLHAVPNARAYQVQYHNGADGSNGTPAWLEAGIFPNTRGISLTELKPGSVYTARVRAVGGSTRYSDWSAPISLMAT